MYTKKMVDPKNMKTEEDTLFASLSATLVEHQKELRETLRNVAIIAAAIAVGALILLGTDLPVNQTLTLIGITLLLGDTVLVIGYLLRTHIQLIDEVNVGMHEILQPLKDILGNNIPNEMVPGILLRVQEKFKLIVARHEHEKSKGHIFEIAILTLLLFGTLMIILGLLLKPICVAWHILCI